jgi:hypothetical protein
VSGDGEIVEGLFEDAVIDVFGIIGFPPEVSEGFEGFGDDLLRVGEYF